MSTEVYSVNSNAHSTQVRIYGDRMRINSAQSSISPVAEFHHVLGHGFMFQQVILILIKCLSANQNRLFYMKV